MARTEAEQAAHFDNNSFLFDTWAVMIILNSVNKNWQFDEQSLHIFRALLTS